MWAITETEQIPEIELTTEQWSDIQNNKKAHFEEEDGYYVVKY